MLIYKITNRLNNKSYVGKTEKTLEFRKHYHFKVMKYSNQYIHRAMMKHGTENFEFSVIEETQDLNAREAFWIKELNTIHPNGYNLTTGGEGGDTWSTTGKKHTEETKRRISASLTGRKLSEEHKRNSALGQIGRTAWNKGKKFKVVKLVGSAKRKYEYLSSDARN